MKNKKKGRGYGVLAVIVMACVLMFTGLAVAEQEWLPGYMDKDGTLGKDGKSWRIGYINTVCSEGETSDAYEGCSRAVTLTADRFYNTPDASGTYALVETIGTTMTLADTKVLIGNSGSLAVPQSVSLTGDVTGSLTNAGGINTTLAVNTVDSTNIIDNSVSSADILNGTIASTDIATNTVSSANILNATITSTDIATNTVSSANILNSTIAGVDMAANSVSTSQFNLNSVTINIAAGSQFNNASVETGSQLIGWYISNAGAINGVTLINTVEWSDPIASVSINSTDGGNQTSFVLQFLRP